MPNRLEDWARTIKRDVHALYLASRDPRVPWYAKALGVAVAAYALSPIDLIPDFIPVLGYLDDLIIVPLGIFAVIRMIPQDSGFRRAGNSPIIVLWGTRRIADRRAPAIRS